MSVFFTNKNSWAVDLLIDVSVIILYQVPGYTFIYIHIVLYKQTLFSATDHRRSGRWPWILPFKRDLERTMVLVPWGHFWFKFWYLYFKFWYLYFEYWYMYLSTMNVSQIAYTVEILGIQTRLETSEFGDACDFCNSCLLFSLVLNLVLYNCTSSDASKYYSAWRM